ncbi:glycosyltransferase [Paenibacillus polymyxa]|uniref:glycosyltransferase n=1 Tax=Paenibacillus polymyxa TaxID=1406 RepID=UPI0039BF8C79
MLLSEKINLITSIIDRNTVKNNMLRSSIIFKLSDVDNLNVNADATLNINEADKAAEITFEVKKDIKFLKFIYNIYNDNDQGSIVLNCYGTNGESQVFEVGAFSGQSISFYLKTDFNIKKIIISISTEYTFNISQLELIGITKSEYKFNKIKQYSLKLNRLVKFQPHLRGKFVQEIRTAGLKPALQKVKQKLYHNDPKDNIIVMGNELILSPLSYASTNSILFIVHDAQNAGASILSLNMIRVLKEVYHKQVIAILLKGGPLEKDFSDVADVINLHQNSLSNLENETEVSRIIKSIRKRGVTYCIANSVVSSILVELLEKNEIKTISLIHELPTSIQTYNFVQAANNAARYASKIVFPNQFVKNSFQQYFDLHEDRVLIKPQGIYKKRLHRLNKNSAKEKLCEELGISTSSTILLGCGYGDLRKGLDSFFSLARELILNCNCKDIHFVWMGGTEQVLERWLMHDAQTLKIEKNIHMMGFQKDPLPIFEAADMFVLTSREDPFPSIALEAIDNATPVVTFENNGGMAELITELGVRATPYSDIHLMAQEIMRILKNKDIYDAIVQKGHEVIEEKFNFTKYVGDILSSINSEVYRIPDLKVSVIVPNYNYESFIEERLRSIINQTVTPYEIIFLDDVSKDNSVELAKRMLEQTSIKHKIIVNKENIGCFGQWIRGIQEASGDIIWIAEADDLCEPVLLERLLPSFSDQEVNLAYSQSQIIDEHSNKVNYHYTQYTDDLSVEKWRVPYCINGKDELVQGLAIKNTIPNASAVLMRASALQGISEKLSDYKIGGDWFAYLYLLRQGKIYFTPEVLNYHRRHSQSIISVNEQTQELYKEILRIKNFIIDNYELPLDIVGSFVEQVAKDYERLGCKGYGSKNILDNDELSEMYLALKDRAFQKSSQVNYLCEQKKILFVTPDFEVGGGQMLVIRLANFFASFQKVYIYNARPWLLEESVLKMVSPSVEILPSKGDPEELRGYIEKFNITTINSHIWWSDKITYLAVKEMTSVNWVLSMHGCYEALLQNPDWDNDFLQLVPNVLERANHIIYATNKNLKIFSEVNISDSSKIKKVYYGYDLQSIPSKNKESIGIREGEFVFGLVSRAIKEKGWEESIKALIQLNNKNQSRSHLILVGESEYSKMLKEKYKDIDYLHFVMNLHEPSEWIGWVKIFDVALLPTYFISESLPNSIIEYLAYNKPVITTNIGEIKQMIYSEKVDKFAGILLELNDEGIVNTDDIYTSMLTLQNDSQKYEELKSNTALLFKQFSMRNFAREYFNVF